MTNKLFFWKDKSGRGGANYVTLTDIEQWQQSAEETKVNYDDERVVPWARNAEVGDEWENASDHFTCTDLPE